MHPHGPMPGQGYAQGYPRGSMGMVPGYVPQQIQSMVPAVEANSANILFMKFVGMETSEQKIKDVMNDPELINVTIKKYTDSPTGHHRYAELLFTSSKALAECSQKNDLKIDNVPIQFTTIKPTSYGNSVAMRDLSIPPAMDLSKASSASEAAIIAAQRLQQQIKANEIPVPITPATTVQATSAHSTIPRGAIRAGTDEERDCISRTVCIKGLPADWDVPRTLNQVVGSMQAMIEKSGLDASSITTSIVAHFKKDELANSGGKHFCLVEFTTHEMTTLVKNTEILDNTGDVLQVEPANQCAREVMPENVVLGVPGQALIHSVMPGQAIREQKMRISSKLDIVRKMKEKLEKGESLQSEQADVSVLPERDPAAPRSRFGLRGPPPPTETAAETSDAPDKRVVSPDIPDRVRESRSCSPGRYTSRISPDRRYKRDRSRDHDRDDDRRSRRNYSPIRRDEDRRRNDRDRGRRRENDYRDDSRYDRRRSSDGNKRRSRTPDYRDRSPSPKRRHRSPEPRRVKDLHTSSGHGTSAAMRAWSDD